MKTRFQTLPFKCDLHRDAEALVADWTSEEREYLRTAVTKDGLQTPFRDGTVGLHNLDPVDPF